MLARLRHAAGQRFQFHPETGWDEGVRAVLRRPVEIAVVDPSLEGAAALRDYVASLRSALDTV